MTDTSSRVQTYLANNKKFAETWKTPPTMEQMQALRVKNGGALLILTCLDPRCVPEEFFGPNIGVGVIRNAGGRATKDAITSITVLRTLAGANTVLVIHHTDCGMSHLTEDGIRTDAKARTPDAAEEIDAVETYGCYNGADLEQTIRDDVEVLKRSKVLAGVEVLGFKFDTEAGVVTEVV